MGALPTPPGWLQVPRHPCALVSARCNLAEAAFSVIKLSRQKVHQYCVLTRVWGNATAAVESSVTESAVTADAASPPLGMDPRRQRWNLARTFSAAGGSEMAWPCCGYHFPTPSPPPFCLSVTCRSLTRSIFTRPSPQNVGKARVLSASSPAKQACQTAGPSIKCDWRDEHIFLCFFPYQVRCGIALSMFLLPLHKKEKDFR